MKTYKELKDALFEEVGKIDISQLGLGYNGLLSYAELLEKISKLPDKTSGELMSDVFWENVCRFTSLETPKAEKR